MDTVIAFPLFFLVNEINENFLGYNLLIHMILSEYISFIFMNEKNTSMLLALLCDRFPI